MGKTLLPTLGLQDARKSWALILLLPRFQIAPAASSDWGQDLSNWEGWIRLGFFPALDRWAQQRAANICLYICAFLLFILALCTPQSRRSVSLT